ncbi:MAG TPA: thiamine pyrophosphate-dependent dehydrogenase E1 component subunit alpha [Candidatus Micrarchaeaceae archaeon]|nr:thiamine pyrophosphate-dependent dehydrogenase E1 component subunit alpha [Candidatus Micrarchaeaceae archaeon]
MTADSPLEATYRAMATIRAFEDRCMELKLAGEIPGSIHLCSGQEAIPVGACRTIEPRDAVTATYRGHGWAIARGLSLVDLFAELLGRDSALCGGRGASLYLSSAPHGFLGENSIVGGGVPIAAGAALAALYDGSSAVSIVSIGDGALSQGAVHEALNFAAVYALPLVVVVENNLYSEMTPVRTMVRIEPLSRRADAYGIPGETVDGNDVDQVQKAVGAAVDRARNGGGPSLIEAMTERLMGHYSGDAQQYRPKGEVAAAREREPLARLRKVAAMQGQEWIRRLEAIDRDAMDIIDGAVASARQIPFPDAATATEHVYG